MSEPFLAEVRIFGFNFAPRGWAMCDGQLLPINQNQALFSLLGTTYGGDGRTTFALPDLRGRVPIHAGSDGGPQRQPGHKGGEETHTLAMNELAQHSHAARASGASADDPSAGGNVLAATKPGDIYAPGQSSLVTLHADSVRPAGGSQPHDNMQPFTALNFCIALQGLFPSRS